MKNTITFIFVLVAYSISSVAQILRSDISLSDPFVMADNKTQYYYMTGTGGGLWKSKDLETWTGPTYPISTSETTWMGASPQVWASEIHYYNDTYYNISTFTNSAITIDSNGHKRRAVHILQSKLPNGTYSVIPDGDPTYLPADKTTLDGTLFVDTDGTPYLLYCHEWIQNGNGTIEYIQLKDDLSGSIGTGKIIMRASDASWNNSAVTDGPFVFRTQTGRLGIIWTSWHGGDYVQGVAYSSNGKLSGTWTQQALPITPDNFGHGMLFRDFNGQLLMSIHSHRTIDASTQHWERHPALFIMDDSGNELKTVMEYKAKIDLQHPTNVMVDNPNFEYGKQGWTSTTNAQNQQIASNQSGAISGKFFESWDPNSCVGEMYQVRNNIPDGTYKVSIAAFRSYPVSGGSENAEVVKIFANDNETVVNSATPKFFSVVVYVTNGTLKFGIRSEKKNYQWMGIDNVTIQYYGVEKYTEDQIDAVDNRVYFRNIKSGKFLNAGQSWGTKALLSEHALDFNLVERPNGRFALDSRLSNGGGNHYADANGYLDGALTDFRVNTTDGKECSLSPDGSHYWGSTSSGAFTATLTSRASNYAKWEMLSYADLVEELKNATKDSPVDATFMISCPNFGRNDTRISEWNGNELTRDGDVTNMCVQAPNTAFNVYQTINNIPNGIYELHVQGFYRDGTAEVAAGRRNAGTENIRALLYANDVSEPLKSIFDEADSKKLPASMAETTSAGNIPATLEGASNMFSAGLYPVTLTVEVKDNTLTLGIKKTTANSPASNWTVFDNFELYYLGDPATGISDIQNDAPNYSNHPENRIFDLSGRIITTPINQLPHGIYIINGKKVIK